MLVTLPRVGAMTGSKRQIQFRMLRITVPSSVRHGGFTEVSCLKNTLLSQDLAVLLIWVDFGLWFRYLDTLWPYRSRARAHPRMHTRMHTCTHAYTQTNNYENIRRRKEKRLNKKHKKQQRKNKNKKQQHARWMCACVLMARSIVLICASALCGFIVFNIIIISS